MENGGPPKRGVLLGSSDFFSQIFVAQFPGTLAAKSFMKKSSTSLTVHQKIVFHCCASESGRGAQ